MRFVTIGAADHPGPVEPPTLPGKRRVPVSVVCVYNDVDVRQQCLDRSLTVLSDEAPDTEYVPVDNTRGVFSTAGAALNYGVQRTHNPYVVFAHQDVFLHSLVALEEAAGLLEESPDFGLVGAVGITRSSAMVGRIRDRVVFSGPTVSGLAEVDSLDEVLFIGSRTRMLKEPLTEDPDLAWHAYAVEYGLRLRGQGLRVGVANVPLTHNSLTTNLARLDVAHAKLAGRYRAALPIQTTCGQIPSPRLSGEALAAMRVPRRGLRLLVDSWVVAGARIGKARSIVRSDVRRDVDLFLEHAPKSRLSVVTVTDDPGTFGTMNPLALTRRGRGIDLWALPLEKALQLIEEMREDSSLLLTDLDKVAARALAGELPDPVVGYHGTVGFWILHHPP